MSSREEEVREAYREWVVSMGGVPYVLTRNCYDITIGFALHVLHMQDRARGEKCPCSKVGTEITCSVCGKMKKPIGRSAPMDMGPTLCDHECKGYMREPAPIPEWPGEYPPKCQKCKEPT